METFFDAGVKYLCSGCRCCEAICPVSAIRMTTDEEGFLYPQIDYKVCIGCNLCKKSCPFVKKSTTEISVEYPKVYAIKNKNQKVLKESSSGGAFSLLAEYVLNHNGYVVGCAFDEDFNPRHIIIESVDDLQRLRGSKYVQSNMEHIYPRVKELLDKGRQVLFTGTPCQVAGIRTYLNDDYENLFTADFVCHGVPSNWIFHKYLRYLEIKNHGKIISYKFRDKEKYGWSSDGSYEIMKDNKIYKKQIFPERDYYIYNFGVNNSILRESCYACKYTSLIRESDFTMADYWGIEKIHPEFYSRNGVSMLMLNSEKAELVFKEISEKMDFISATIDKVKEAFVHLQQPVSRPFLRNFVYSRAKNLGFERAVNTHCKLQYVRPIVRRWIPVGIKHKLKKILKS